MLKKIIIITAFLFNWNLLFSQNTWSEILKEKKGKVVVHFYDSENYIYYKNDKLTGIEYDLLLAFFSFIEKKHQVSLNVEFVHANSFGDLYNTIKNGENGIFGACSFSITQERLNQVNFTPRYMADVELLLSSQDYQIITDTSYFVKHFSDATAYIVKNTTFEEDYKLLKNLIPSIKVKYVKTGIEVIDMITKNKKAIGFVELPNYLTYIKRKQNFERQPLFKFERIGHGIIYPKSSDWKVPLDEFFSSRFYRKTIKKILHKHLGDDIQDLLWEKENYNQINEINLLNKEVKIQKGTIEQKDSEAQTKAFERKIIEIVSIFTLALLVVLFFSNKKNKKVNRLLKMQNLLIEEANKNILDSITYAKRIQSAILPQPKLVKEYFKDSFIFYQPKDIVAGDFYWFEVIENTIFFAAADCTGHGVPGAMVSVVCHNALNRSVKEYKLKKPSDILDKTREIVIAEFAKSDEDVNDGMDISLCVMEIDTQKLAWAGAHNPLWILRNNEILEFKADKQPIGKFDFAHKFSNHEIDLKSNDELYIFTDGFQDQFGGEKGKKIKSSNLRELIILHQSISMEEKRKVIEIAFKNWKGNLEQVDDVCIIGIKI